MDWKISIIIITEYRQLNCYSKLVPGFGSGWYRSRI